MDYLEVAGRQLLDRRGVVHRELHRIDVGKDLGRLSPHSYSHVVSGLSLGERSYVHLHPFDPRRRDRLGPQEQARQRLKCRSRLCVQCCDRTLCIGDHSGQISGQLDLQSGDRVGDQHLVVARTPIPCRGVQVGLGAPATSFQSSRHPGDSPSPW